MVITIGGGMPVADIYIYNDCHEQKRLRQKAGERCFYEIARYEHVFVDFHPLSSSAF